jgi:hypothetical protein
MASRFLPKCHHLHWLNTDTCFEVLLLHYSRICYHENFLCRRLSCIEPKGFPIQHSNFLFVFLSLSWKFIISLAQFLCQRRSWAVTLKVRVVISHTNLAHAHTYILRCMFLPSWMCILLCVKSEVLMPVNVNIAFFWYVMSYCLVM